MELGGYPIEKVERQEAGSESVGLLAALVILLVAFGSALAAGLPLGIAGFGLGVALGGVWLMANVLDVPDFGVQIATMIGIGVGIDYALFIVTRYRSALAEGREPREAVLLAGGTAGRAVVFAGSTVVVSIFGLVLMGRDYLWGVALADLPARSRRWCSPRSPCCPPCSASPAAPSTGSACRGSATTSTGAARCRGGGAG